MRDVEPDPSQPDSYACERVRRALAGDPAVGELGISVSIAGGRAFLTGEVATPERRQAVADVATRILPGYEIHNDVAVTPLDEPGVEAL